MSRRVFLLSIIVLLLAFPVFTAKAYNDDSTHYELTREAVDFYSAYSGRVFSSEEREWVARGGVDEDFPPRWVNHFYDPVHNEPWLGRYGGNVDTGDYAIYAKLLTGQKEGEIKPENFMKVIGPAFGITKTYTSKDWSQNEQAQAAYNRYKGNRTWQRALYEYTNGNKKEGLYTLGFILHLIEDATVPDHTRGDTHKENPFSDDPGSPYEKWAERLTLSTDLQIAENLINTTEKPIKVDSLNQVFDLVANYSNRNFFSEDTIDDKRFPSPKFRYLGGNFFGSNLDGQELRLFYLDEKDENNIIKTLKHDLIMRDYWSHLSPLAVKAGAGIMEYFFSEVERIEKEKEKLKKPETAKLKMISPLGEVTRLQQGAKTLAKNIKQAANKVKNKAIALAKQITQTQEKIEQNLSKVLGESVSITPQPLPQPITIEQPVYRAALASASSGQISTHPSADYPITVAYRNEGNIPWLKSFTDGQVSLNIVGGVPAALKHPSWLTDSRPAAVSKDINPAQQEVFNFSIKSPSAPGSYSLALRPVIYQEGRFQYLGGPENQFNVAVTVVEEKPEEEEQPDGQAVDSKEQTAKRDDQAVDSSQQTIERNESQPSDLSDGAPTDPLPASPSQSAPPAFIIIHGRDATPPQTSVNLLSASQTTADFLVSWQGRDNTRDGQVVFSIQYQVNGGDWLDWLNDTTETEATFTGENGNTYGFRSSGRDNEGNRSEYPESAETETYVNTRRPDPAQITSHSDGQILNATGITLAGTAEALNLITVNLSPAGTSATTTADAVGAWSADFVLSEGDNVLTVTAQESDGDISDAATLNLTVSLPSEDPVSEEPSREVVINEIAWMGTAASANDEWLELYNNTEEDIDLTGWTLQAEDSAPGINLTGIIAAQSYFLLERTDDTTISDIGADQIYTGALHNEGELLILRDAADGLIDQAGSSTPVWFAGDNDTKQTMERKDTTASGVEQDNWASNDLSRRNGKDADGNDLSGTPGAFNSVNTNLPPPPDEEEEESEDEVGAASVDQSQTLFNVNTFWGWNGRRALQSIAQTFIPSKPNLTGFNFRLCRAAAAQTALRVYLCAGEPAQGATSLCPGGIALWSKEYTVAETQALLSTCVLTDQPPVINFNFDPIAVTPGNTYSFVFRSNTFNYSNPFISCYQADTNPYLSGQMWYESRPGVPFKPVATFATSSDWYFETLGTD